MRTLLSDPRARLYFVASGISTLGDYALYIALGVWVKLLTGSTGEAGVAFLMLVLGLLFSPLTGILVDRSRRRELLVATYLFTAAVLTALLAVHGRGQVWIIFAVSFLYGVSGAVTYGTQQALVQSIVPAELLADANGVQQTATQGMRLVTPLIGVGLLTWLGGHAVALVDVATFLVAAALMTRVRVDEPVPAARAAGGAEPRVHWTADVATGFRYVVRTAVLRQICVALAVTVLFAGFFETLALQIATVGLHHHPGWIGVMISVQGVGGLAGGMTAGAIARRVGDGLLTAAGLAATVVFSLLVAVPADAVVLAGAVCCGLGLPWVVVGAMTVTQKNTPPAMMGRVGGAVDLSVQAPQAVGVAVGAAVVDHVFYRDLCFLIAAGVGVMAVYLATRKEQRMPRKTEVEETAAADDDEDEDDGFQVRDAAGHAGEIRDIRGGVV